MAAEGGWLRGASKQDGGRRMVNCETTGQRPTEFLDSGFTHVGCQAMRRVYVYQLRVAVTVDGCRPSNRVDVAVRWEYWIREDSEPNVKNTIHGT